MYGHVLGARATLLDGGAAGTLPFTGLSLVWWVLLGVTLLVVGTSLLCTSRALARTRRGDLPEAVPR